MEGYHPVMTLYLIWTHFAMNETRGFLYHVTTPEKKGLQVGDVSKTKGWPASPSFNNSSSSFSDLRWWALSSLQVEYWKMTVYLFTSMSYFWNNSLFVSPIIPIIPFMVISFTYVMSCDTYFDYFIYDDTTSDYSQLSLPRPTESESNISIYLIIYLFTIPCSSYL